MILDGQTVDLASKFWLFLNPKDHWPSQISKNIGMNKCIEYSLSSYCIHMYVWIINYDAYYIWICICVLYIYIYQPRTCITCDRGDFRVASDGLFMSGAPGQDQRLGVFFGRRSGSGNRAMTWCNGVVTYIEIWHMSKTNKMQQDWSWGGVLRKPYKSHANLEIEDELEP